MRSHMKVHKHSNRRLTDATTNSALHTVLSATRDCTTMRRRYRITLAALPKWYEARFWLKSVVKAPENTVVIVTTRRTMQGRQSKQTHSEVFVRLYPMIHTTPHYGGTRLGTKGAGLPVSTPM